MEKKASFFYTVGHLKNFLLCDSLILDISHSFSGLSFLIYQLEGWAIHCKVPFCSDFSLFSYIILERLKVGFEVGCM